MFHRQHPGMPVCAGNIKQMDGGNRYFEALLKVLRLLAKLGCIDINNR